MEKQTMKIRNQAKTIQKKNKEIEELKKELTKLKKKVPKEEKENIIYERQVKSPPKIVENNYSKVLTSSVTSMQKC